MFSALIVAYLFLGGSGAGALVVLCVLECLDAQRHQGQRRRALLAMAGLYGQGIGGSTSRAPHLPRNFYARAWPIALVMLATGILCLLCDIGHPERVLALVFSPEPTAVTVGSYALVVSLGVACAFAGLSLFEGFDIPMSAVRAVGVVGVVAGVVTISYTGILLQGMASVVFWQTPLLPAVFVLSALSCGMACVFVALAFTESRVTLVFPTSVFAMLDSAFILLEAVALAAFVAVGFMHEESRDAAQALFSGDLRWLFWGGIVGIGLVVPFVLERLSVPEGRRFQLLWTGAFVLAGGLMLRFCVVAAASYDVTQAAGSFLGLAVL